MPRGDGTGPTGAGPRTGRGAGRGGASGGRGRMGGFGLGGGGHCVCPSCGKTAPHQRATPCNQRNCPNCGARMTRQQ